MNMFRPILLIMMFLLCQMWVLPMQAQENLEGRYFPKIGELLDAGQCERAQRLYNVYKQTANRTDKGIEQRIEACKRRGKQGSAISNISSKGINDTRPKAKNDIGSKAKNRSRHAKNESSKLVGGPEESRGRNSVGIGKTQEGNTFFSVGEEGVPFTMVWVEGGTFIMGCSSEQGNDCWDIEKPIHTVALNSYYICETEVTQALWMAVMGNNPSYNKGDNLPVECVSWDDVQEFIQKLNKLMEGLGHYTFRLPTEAEWEYAARGGNKSHGYKYSGSNSIDAVAWYEGNSGGKTHPVKGKQANELGLYDMSGNVWEWVLDWSGPYVSSPQHDPQGPSTSSTRVDRGGSMSRIALYSRVSSRNYNTPTDRGGDCGFRLVLVP